LFWINLFLDGGDDSVARLKLLLSEDTPITVGVLVIIVGGILWLAAMESNGRANTEAIVEMKASQTTYTANIIEINNRLSKMEGFVLGLRANGSKGKISSGTE
jgi:hypothetical protein